MADKKERELAVPGSINVDTDYIRMLSGESEETLVSVKQDFAVVAKSIIEDYEGSILGETQRSVKSAIGNAIESIGTLSTEINAETTGLQARSITAPELTLLEEKLNIE